MLRRVVPVQKEEEEGCAWCYAWVSGVAVPWQTSLPHLCIQIKTVIQTGPAWTGLCDSVVGEAVKYSYGEYTMRNMIDRSRSLVQ